MSWTEQMVAAPEAALASPTSTSDRASASTTESGYGLPARTATLASEQCRTQPSPGHGREVLA
ncbi:hypothetical protein ABIB49_000859 [Arthrobacter sp. UYCu512]